MRVTGNISGGRIKFVDQNNQIQIKTLKYGFRVKLWFSNGDVTIKQHSGFRIKNEANKRKKVMECQT